MGTAILHLKSAKNKLLASFADELTTIVSILAIGAVAGHILFDFVEVKLSDLPNIQAHFRSSLWLIVWASIGWILGGPNAPGLASWCRQVGVAEPKIRSSEITYRLWATVTWGAFLFLLTAYQLGTPGIGSMIGGFAIGFLLTWLRRIPPLAKPLRLAHWPIWRLEVLLARNRWSMGTATLSLSFLIYGGFLGGPLRLWLCQASGLLFVIPFASLAAQDARSAYWQKLMGISHERFVREYEWTCLSGVAIPALTFAVLCDVPGALNFALPTLILPWVMFQLDIRKPISMILLTMIPSILCGTLIFAFPLAALGIPLGRWGLLNYQTGRFYRA